MSVAEVMPPYSGAAPRPSDRTPPQDIDAEQSVLGGMLLSKDAIADVVEVLRGADFYRPAHELIYDAILDLYGRGEPADAITVSDELTKRGELAADRRRGLPAHADRRGPHRRQRRLLRARSCASGRSCAAWSRPAPDRPDGLRQRERRRRRHRRRAPRPRSTRSAERRAARTTTPLSATSCEGTLDEIEAIESRVQRRHGRRAHRVRRPRRADQRPAPRAR